MSKATFVSVWNEEIEVMSNCNYDKESNAVSEIELPVENDELDLDVLTDEYVLLESGEKIRDFEVTDFNSPLNNPIGL